MTESSTKYVNIASDRKMWPDEVAHYSYMLSLGEAFMSESN